MVKFWLFLFLLSVFSLPSTVSAHFINTENQIKPVLHIDPNDQPKANQSLSLEIQFIDKPTNFSITDCLCTIEIFQNNQSLFKEKLRKGDGDFKAQSIAYTFLNAGDYIVTISGSALNQADFEPFKADMAIKVEPENNIFLNHNYNNYYLCGILLIVILGLIGYIKRQTN